MLPFDLLYSCVQVHWGEKEVKFHLVEKCRIIKKFIVIYVHFYIVKKEDRYCKT